MTKAFVSSQNLEVVLIGSSILCWLRRTFQEMEVEIDTVLGLVCLFQRKHSNVPSSEVTKFVPCTKNVVCVCTARFVALSFALCVSIDVKSTSEVVC